MPQPDNRSSPFFAMLLAALIAICSGCSVPKYVASSNQAEGTRKVYQEGLELLISEERHSIVTAGLPRLTEKEKHMQLILLVQNRGSEAFNVKPTQIEVLFEQEESSETLPIYPPSEAAAKITFDERLTAALNAAAATYNQNTEIDTEANANLAQGNALAAIAEGKSVRSTLLRKETLFPGDQIAGAAYFALKDRGRLTIKIPAGQDTHTFYFEAQENWVTRLTGGYGDLRARALRGWDAFNLLAWEAHLFKPISASPESLLVLASLGRTSGTIRRTPLVDDR